MKRYSAIIVLALILFSCTNSKTVQIESTSNQIIGEVSSYSIIGNLIESTTVQPSYNADGVINKILLTNRAPLDTFITQLEVRYDAQNRVSKISGLIISEYLNPDKVEHDYLTVEYSDQGFQRLEYRNYLIQDFIYEDNHATSYKLYYHVDGIIDSFGTRMIKMEYDTANNVSVFTDTRISDRRVFADVTLRYDSTMNWLNNNILSLVPHFDFASFQSSNQCIQVNSRVEESGVRDYKIERQYSDQGLWESSIAEFIGGALLVDIVYYRSDFEAH